MGVPASKPNNKRKNSSNNNKSNKKIKANDNTLIYYPLLDNSTPFQITKLPVMSPEDIKNLNNQLNQWSIGGFKLSKEPVGSNKQDPQYLQKKIVNILGSKAYGNIFLAKGSEESVYKTNTDLDSKIIFNKYNSNYARINNNSQAKLAGMSGMLAENINEPKTDSEISFIQAITNTLNPKLLQKKDDYLFSDLHRNINEYEQNLDKDKNLRVKFYIRNSSLPPCVDTEKTRQRIGIACNNYLQQFIDNLKAQYENHDFRMKVSSGAIKFPTFDKDKNTDDKTQFNEIFKKPISKLQTDVNNVSDECIDKIVKYNQWAAKNNYELINTGMSRYGTSGYDDVSMYRNLTEDKLKDKIRKDFDEINTIYRKQ